MANPATSFIWYELLTLDPAESKRFYDAVVGWNIAEQSVAPGIEYRMIERTGGGNAGGMMTLSEEMCSNGARPLWVGYLHAPNVDGVVAAMETDGATVLKAPWDQSGVGRLAMVADPSGAPFCLMDPLPPEEQPDETGNVFSVDQPQHIRWNELSTSDPAGAIDFYTRHFGWVQNGDMDMGPMGKYQFLYENGVMIGAIMPRMPQMPVSLWKYYIGVDDIDRAAAAVTAGGGQILHGPQEIPGGEYSLNAMDPQGASFALVGPREQQASA